MTKEATVRKIRPTASERYKAQGKILFACWVDPSVVRAIKMVAGIENKNISTIITERFSDVKFEQTGRKVVVKFVRSEEETPATVE